MTLIALLICLAAQHYYNVNNTGQLRWLKSYLAGMTNLFFDNKVLQGWSGALWLILPLVLITLALAVLVNAWSWLAGFIFNVAILFFCVGPYKPGGLRDIKIKPEEVQHTLASVNDELFAVVFWFIVLGPAGAVLYRMSCLLPRHLEEGDEVASYIYRIKGMLDWIPTRLIGLTYALIGRHFFAVFKYWHESLSVGFAKSNEFMWRTALRAVGSLNVSLTHVSEEEGTAVIDLVLRAQIIWLVLLAVFTIGMWVA